MWRLPPLLLHTYTVSHRHRLVLAQPFSYAQTSRAHPCTKVVLVFLLLLIRWRSTLVVILPLELYFNCHLKTCLGKSLYVDTYTYKYAYPYMPFLIWFFFVFCVLLTSNWKRPFLLFFFFAITMYDFCCCYIRLFYQSKIFAQRYS